jgi:hypothetical protein
MTAKSQVTAPSRSFFQQFKDQHPLFFVITWHENSVVNPKLFFSDPDPDPIFIRVLDPLWIVKKLRIQLRIRP